jgi:hypothetical protein
MWMILYIVLGAVLCFVVMRFMQGFVTEFFKMRQQGRPPRLRIFDEE